MKNLLLILLILFTSILSFSQTDDWFWAVSAGGINPDKGNSITVDTDDNIIMTGTLGSSNIIFGTDTLTNAGVFIAKYDPSGNALWAKCATGSSWAEGYDVTSDADNNIIITGEFSPPYIILGTDTLYTATANIWDNTDVFIVKYDPSGNLIWAKSAGGCAFEDGASVSSDENNNIVVSGHFYSSFITFGTDTLYKCDSLFSPDIYIVKFDPMGNVLWAKSEGGSGWDNIKSITTDFNNNIITMGRYPDSTITFGTDTFTNFGSDNIFIVKYDSLGDVLWAKKCSGGTYKEITSDADNNYIITGYFSTSTITFGTEALTNAGSNNIFIVKFDTSGNVLWAKSAGGNNSDGSNSVTTDFNNNIIITGNFQSPIVTFGTDTITNADSANIFIVKYDPSGNVLWAKSTGRGSATSIISDLNNNVIIMGGFWSASIAFGTTVLSNVSEGSYDIFIAKLNGSVGVFENNVQDEIIIYPNPANNNIIIGNIAHNKDAIISIYDAQGQMLFKQISQHGKTEIDVSGFVNGVYLIKFESPNLYKVGKFIKQ